MASVHRLDSRWDVPFGHGFHAWQVKEKYI
jgi:hypothetical protein